jgi:hypothetical protein
MRNYMIQMLLGLGFLLFGISVGGVGIASAGVGIGIPMIPIGIYLSYRGWRIFKNEKVIKESDLVSPEPLVPFEKTKAGKIGLGLILILIGVATSAMLIGIPIVLVGLWLMYTAFKDQIRKKIGDFIP